MRYLKKTFEYLSFEKGKRFLTLFLLSLPVGITAAFVTPTWAYTAWITDFTVGNYNFWEAWNFGDTIFVLPLAIVLFVIATIIFLSIQVSIISRSLRVGVFKVNGLFSEFNESFFISLYGVIGYIIVYLVYKALTTIFLVLWQTISSATLSLILSIISLLIIFTVLVIWFAYTILYIPLMAFNGVKPKTALINSIHKCSKNILGLSLSIGIPILVVNGIGMLIGLFQIPLLAEIVDSLLYSFLFCYVVSLTMISYYEIEQIKREDYPREYFYKR